MIDSCRIRKVFGFAAAILFSASTASAQTIAGGDPFARLTQTELGLGAFRSANGAPAENYWQQRVDYDIEVALQPGEQRLEASALVRYYNRSPDTLDTLYFALDHDALKNGSAAEFRLLTGDETARQIATARNGTSSGFNIQSVKRANGEALEWRTKDTLLQIRLSNPLKSGEQLNLSLQWQLPLTDKRATAVRSGYEMLDDGKRIFVAAQWFPRAVAYTDYAGWQLKPFLQQGEFSTEFGRYRVRISAPENYVVAASGDLQNPRQVLDRQQLRAWQSDSPGPRWVVDESQADRNRSRTTRKQKQWLFSGESLRDFAFAASPSFQWQVKRDSAGRRLQLFFPEEAASLWRTFGLEAIDHTLKSFDEATFTLPLETISVVNAAGIGMEYPGLATIATRPERDETMAEETGTNQPPWDALTKYDFIGSIIHEVGHNYLPMAINTDEREWAWLDEGLVSFIEYHAEHAWEANFDVIYGEPRSVADYTASEVHQPIMTSADSLHRKIGNAYNKTASVLNMLRHLVLTPEDFDLALRRFAINWQGKRPMPGDFFRAMEAAAGEDLSWFWRSWFFEAHSVDFAVAAIKHKGISHTLHMTEQREPPAIAYTAGGIQEFVVDRQPAMADAYTQPLQAGTTPTESTGTLPVPSERTSWYSITLKNLGSGVLPLPLQVTTEKGLSYQLRIPPQTWMRAQRGTLELQLPLPEEDALSGLCIDPLWLTPDTDRSNNCIEIKQS
ncbi:hypothetical protein AWR36_002360 [Microbulbifer flavimaris]|uniref:Peptidase M1 membrane alanine aminopeptidase domain-containing protein n=1 Tax=Microbulbifer flavimaris TaxID=1781068 RepID=A0ABX4I3D5_9GAMM|nr:MULTISPECIES: M1 family metallopeptidase [Microbulbifer]KUJ84534.1 hypothetical protein AVO43_02365 [Microbulbifer sp. ZGT114]PCO06621.1 hypothetical protein AWR36_002360 [Microbulbifer flavimaris]